ncbi:MAG TPA: ATP-binding cassette domain-containing protein [Polyangiales bacterium]|nr:ATP-binding cassette domain-containing protein [Polyangiales bacterium]
MTAVRVRALRKTFQRRVRKPGRSGLMRSWISGSVETHEAVRGIDFTVESGESLALIGPNGAGKSTTLKLLTGILYPTSGEAQVLGLTPWRERTRLAMNIATVFGQRSQLWYDLPAEESFELLARIYELPRSEFHARRAALVRRFELEPLLATQVRKLSLGQRMRCEIAASLLHRPRVLFLDEPTIGLDVVAKQEIRSLVRELNRDEGVTVVLTSHDAGDIEHLCERILLINHGSIVYHDRVSTLAARYLKRKTIEVRLAAAVEHRPQITGAVALESHALGLKLAVDTSTNALGDVLAQLVSQLPVADITIEDPPLENILGDMYRDLPPPGANHAGLE